VTLIFSENNLIHNTQGGFEEALYKIRGLR